MTARLKISRFLKPPHRARGLFLVAPFAGLVLLPAYAGSVRAGASDIQIVSFKPSEVSPSMADDTCLPLLKNVSPGPPAAIDGTQRTAGTAAAQASTLSLVLGVRFALGPLEDTGLGSRSHRVTAAHVNLLEPGLAVSAYRKCVKKEALQTPRSRRTG